MGLFLFIYCIFFPVLFLMLFFIFSKKEKNEFLLNSSFECGFTSYFYSRFSFSIHYFLVGLIFLFLDLELCIIMPFVSSFSNNVNHFSILGAFISLLLWGLMKEWEEGKLSWLK